MQEAQTSADGFPVNVSRETLGRLNDFLDLVLRWSGTVNLVGPASREEAWRRHVIDSAQLLPLVGRDFRLWADLGSGGGFPGLVVAIMARDSVPDGKFVLVESDQRKAEFLRVAAERVAPATQIVAARAEQAAPLGADVVSARALAPLPVLLGLAKRHLGDGGLALFPKGRSAKAEIDAARATWRFEAETVRSCTDCESEIVIVRHVEPVSA